MADIVRIVDSISATPTTLLDLNDETSWWTRRLSAPPPRLRRSVAQNSLRDGDYDAASSYASRVVELDLESIESTQDASATQLQTLFRLLDNAAGKYLMYQPQGASKPVFFVLRRSDTAALVDAMAQAAMRTLTVELSAEPFALGLMETLGPYVVTNDPAAASNGCHFDATGIVGDVATPLLLSLEGNTTGDSGWIIATERDPGASVVWAQAESGTLGTDTTNPGGGPDAAMSGSGTNNYLRTSFTTNTTLTPVRLTVSPAPSTGLYRILVVVRRSDSTSAINVALTQRPADAVATALTTGRQIVDLGLREFGTQARVGLTENTMDTLALQLSAERTSGTGTLDWDHIYLLPASGETAILQAVPTVSPQKLVVDGIRERVPYVDSGDPFDGSAVMMTDSSAPMTGAFPMVMPNDTNRIHLLSWFSLTETWAPHSVTTTHDVEAAYWPRYLFVRPVSS